MFETPDDWWKYFSTNEDYIRELIYFHPTNNPCSHNHLITAPKAEAACDDIRNDIRSKENIDPYKKFHLLKEEKSTDMVGFLNEIWFGLPESEMVHNLRGFGPLCTLCEEADVLYEAE